VIQGKVRIYFRRVKNESSFEVIILRGVVLAFYRFEIFCEKKKLGFGLVVLKRVKVIRLW